ncbi:MAG: MMPL family transporter [Hyphomicrobiales bacterium]
MTSTQDPGARPLPPSIGFGLENLGLVAVRRPLLGALIILALSLFAALGLTRIGFDDELRNIFRSTSIDHKTFVAFEAAFGNTESDFFILVEGDRLATPEALAKLREFTFDLRLEDGVASAVSLFSLRKVPDANGDAPTVMPEAIPSGPALEELLAEIDSHPLGLGKLISRDRRAALVIVAAERDAQELKTAKVMYGELQKLAATAFEPLGLSVEVTGIPVLRVELVNRLLADQVRIITLGVLLSFLMSAFIFRSLVGALVTTIPSLVAVLWVIGLMGVFGVHINLTTTILPVLILVLAFADSMHLTVHMMREHVAGRSLKESALAAVREVGPACVLTSLTTAIAFLTLTFSDSFAIRQLGIAGSMATMLSFAAVVTVGPLLFLLIARGPIAPPAETGRLFHFLGFFSHHAGELSWRRPLVTAAVGLLVVLLFGFGHSRLRPEFSFREHLGEKIPRSRRWAASITILAAPTPSTS